MPALAAQQPDLTPTATRLQLIDNGYLPIPVNGKRPRVANWSSICATPAAVAAWERGHTDHLNTGILTGAVVAIDIDAMDAAVAARLVDRLLEVEDAGLAPCRIGMAPKSLFVFRTTEPRMKRKTAEYLINGAKCQVEALGTGQQFVAFGIHPDTAKPYVWTGADLLSVPFAELPEISPEAVDAFLVDAGAILAEAGTAVRQQHERPERPSGGETFWQRVNSAALGSINLWVRDVFPTAKLEAGTGAWRVTSRDLGRSLEEDISIHPDGVQDFGLEAGTTPIQLVVDFGPASTPKEGAHWLCERIGIDPADLGWSSNSSMQKDGALLSAGLVAGAKTPVAANDNKPPAKWPGIVSSGQLIASFTPPDFHIDGIIQSGFFYSLTAPTGTGKTAILLKIASLTARGLPLGDREVRKGRVIYFAGENPADVTMRWIGEAHHAGFDGSTIDVHFVPGAFNIAGLKEQVAAGVSALGGVDLVIVDTSAAYFLGADENSNAEIGKHARMLRALTTIEGSPCVLVACHPTKNAAADNLLPRGGGAFIAEVDGNLCASRAGDAAVKLHWQGKHRGPDFEPVMFELRTVTAPTLQDTRGRDIPTVVASVISSAEVGQRKAVERRDEDDLLMEIEINGKRSLYDFADALGWRTDDGKPNKRRASTASDKLKRTKLVEYVERVGWKLTKIGLEAVGEVRAERHRETSAAVGASRLAAKSRPWGGQ